MNVGNARQPRHVLVDPRVVLHSARAQGVKDRVDREVALREMREVADNVEFADLGQAQVRAEHLAAQVVDVGHVERGQLVPRRTWPGQLREQRLWL